MGAAAVVDVGPVVGGAEAGGDVAVAAGEVVVVTVDVGSVDAVLVGTVTVAALEAVGEEPRSPLPESVAVEVAVTMVSLAARRGEGVSETLLRTVPTAADAMPTDSAVAPTQARVSAIFRGIAPSCLSGSVVG